MFWLFYIYIYIYILAATPAFGGPVVRPWTISLSSSTSFSNHSPPHKPSTRPETPSPLLIIIHPYWTYPDPTLITPHSINHALILLNPLLRFRSHLTPLNLCFLASDYPSSYQTYPNVDPWLASSQSKVDVATSFKYLSSVSIFWQKIQSWI